MKDRGTFWWGVAWFAVALVGVAVYAHMAHQPFYHDANGYVSAAEGMRTSGVISEWPLSYIRTYAYPWALSGMLGVADAFNVGRVAVIFACQWALFVAAAWIAAVTLFRARRTRILAFVAVAANPLLVIYTPQALTETVSLACILLAAGALGRSSTSKSALAQVAWMAAGAFFAGFSLAARPGNIFVPICYALAVVVALVRSRKQLSWTTTVTTAVAVLIAISLPLAPQAAINWKYFDTVTVLPVTNLAVSQSADGVRNIRYATNVSTCGEPAMPFPSPFPGAVAPDATQAEMLAFYAFEWPTGPETAALHLFSGLDPRPFLTYQVSYGVWYERVLQVLTVALIGLAGIGIARAPWSRSRLTPGVVFIGSTTVFSAAVVATTQAELRFGIVLVTALSLVAASAAARLGRPTLRMSWVALLWLGAASLAWFSVSDLILAGSAQWVSCR